MFKFLTSFIFITNYYYHLPYDTIKYTENIEDINIQKSQSQVLT